MHTHTHFRGIWDKNTSTFLRVYWKGACGENKINDFNFILASQTPIKLKEKLTSGCCECYAVTWLMCEGKFIPKAHRWFFYSHDFRVKLYTLLAAECWYKKICFLNKVFLPKVCLSKKERFIISRFDLLDIQLGLHKPWSPQCLAQQSKEHVYTFTFYLWESLLQGVFSKTKYLPSLVCSNRTLTNLNIGNNLLTRSPMQVCSMSRTTNRHMQTV